MSRREHHKNDALQAVALQYESGYDTPSATRRITTQSLNEDHLYRYTEPQDERVHGVPVSQHIPRLPHRSGGLPKLFALFMCLVCITCMCMVGTIAVVLPLYDQLTTKHEQLLDAISPYVTVTRTNGTLRGEPLRTSIHTIRQRLDQLDRELNHENSPF